MPTATKATTNGRHQQGRAVPPELLYEHTFQDTGRTIQIRKLSALARDEVRRQVKRSPGFEEPQPPVVEVDYGEGKIRQPHRAHPVYQDLLKEWNARVTQEAGERIAAFAIRRAAVCEVDKAAVQDTRAFMASINTPLDEYDDLYVYIAFVCVGSQQDYNEFLAAVFNRSIPSQEAIQAHLDSFPGRTGREIDLASEPGPADRPASDPL